MTLELFIWNYALFIFAIFWGLRVDEMGAEDREVEEHKHPFIKSDVREEKNKENK